MKGMSSTLHMNPANRMQGLQVDPQKLSVTTGGRETIQPARIHNALPGSKATASAWVDRDGKASTPSQLEMNSEHLMHARCIVEAFRALFWRSDKTTPPLGDVVLATLTNGISCASGQREGLAAVLRPWRSFLVSTYGEASAPLAPWMVAMLLQQLFHDLDHSHGERLLPFIWTFADDLSLAQWVAALSQPRHEQHGTLRLRDLKEDTHWQSLEADLRAALPVVKPTQQTSVAAAATGLMHFGTAALVAHISPPLAFAAMAVGTASSVGNWAHALRAQQRMIDEDHQHTLLPGMPSALAAQAAALMAVALPSWSPTHHTSLISLWWSDPAGWTLLDAAEQAQRKVKDGGSIKDALVVISQERQTISETQTLPPIRAIDVLPDLLQWFFSEGPGPFADRTMDLARRGGLKGGFSALPTSTVQAVPTCTATPSVSSPAALQQVAEYAERRGHQLRLQALIDRRPVPQSGRSAGESSRARHKHRIEKGHLKLRQAQFAHGPARRDAISGARLHLNDLTDRIGLAALAAAGDIAGAVKANGQAARSHEPVAGRVVSRAPVDTTKLKPAASPAPRFSPGWLGALLPAIPGLRSIANAGADLAGASARLLPPSSGVGPLAATAPARLIGAVASPGRLKPLNAMRPLYEAVKLAAHGAFVLGGSALGNYFFRRYDKVPQAPDESIDSADVVSPRRVDLAAKSDEELIGLMERTVVALPDGSWASAWDVWEAGAASGSHRRRRSVNQGRTSNSLPVSTGSAAGKVGDVLLGQDGSADSRWQAITPKQVEDVRTKHQMEMAILRRLAKTKDYQWLNQLTEAEQRLWFTERHVAAQADKAWNELGASAITRLDALLRQTGWLGPWQSIEVKVSGSKVDGKPIDDRIPLLQYCLYRPSTTGEVRFLRGDEEVTPDQSRILTAVMASQARKELVNSVQSPSSVNAQVADGLSAKFKKDALESKARGALTGGGDAFLRGADIVLGFINHSAHVESSRIRFTGLEDVNVPTSNTQSSKQFDVPDYLVLRSSQSDPDEQRRGQVVLYRSKLRSFTTFANEESFRQFISERSLTYDLAGDWRFKNDVIRAAPVEYQNTLRQCFFSDSFVGRPAGWLQRPHIALNFKASTGADASILRWATDQWTSRKKQAQQLWNDELIRWSPLGVRAQQANNELELAQHPMKLRQEHARPEMIKLMNTVVRSLSFPDGQGDLADPFSQEHHIELQFEGRSGDIAYWGTEGWFMHGPKDSPGSAFPSSDSLASMSFTVYRKDENGDLVVDKRRTGWLNNADFLRNFCYSMRDLVNSNRLGRAYEVYLKEWIVSEEGRRFVLASAEAIRWRLRALIERAAQPGGVLDADAYRDLLEEFRKIDGLGASVGSSLKLVELVKYTIQGLWAMSARGRDYVFVLQGPDGDALMDKPTFESFLNDDRHRAEQFIRNLGAYRYHPSLADLFGRTRSSGGITVNFKRTPGPVYAAQAFVNKLIDNSNEFTVTSSEQLRFLGGLLLTGVCILGTGGVAAFGCTLGTLAFVVDSLINARDAWDRGNRNEAIAELLGAGFDLMDVFDASKMGLMLFKLGKRAFGSTGEAEAGLRQLARQSSAFDKQGNLDSGFALPMQTEPRAQTGVDGNPEWVLGEKTYVRTDKGDFVEAPLDENGVRRAKDPLDSQAPGAPIDFQGGQWRRLDQQPDLNARFISQVREKIPEAKWANADDLERVRAIEGVHHAGQLGATGRSAIVKAGRKALIKDVAADGPAEKLHGTTALLIGWALTPQVSFGLRVDIIPQWRLGTPHIRLGSGQGALIGLPPGDIPGMTIGKMIELAGRAPLIARLGLSSNATDADLQAAVLRHIRQTLSSRSTDILNHWESVETLLAGLPGDVQTLRKYFPGLTADEANEVLQADRDVLVKAKRNDNLGRVMGNVAGRRHQRQARTRVLDGRISRLDEVNTLGVLLQEAIPNIRIRTLGGASHIDLQLERSTILGQSALIDTIRFTSTGDVQVLKNGAWVKAQNWEEAVVSVLSDAERASLGDGQIRNAVEHAMARRPLAEICPLRSRSKKSDCEAAAVSADISRVSLTTQEEVVERSLLPNVEELRISVNKIVADKIDENDRAFTAMYLEKYGSATSKGQLDKLDRKGRSVLAYKVQKGDDQEYWSQQDSPAVLFGKSMGLQNKLLSTNLMAVNVDLQHHGHTIAFTKYYSSNKVTNDLGPVIHPADDAKDVVVKATKIEGSGPADSAQFYVKDVDRENLFADEYLFGTDAWQQKGADFASGEAKFSNQQLMTPEKRAELKVKKVDEKTLSRIEDGDYFYEATIRSCSESSFLNDLWNQLAKVIPDKFARGAAPEDFSGLTGTITMFTESAPCPQVCSRRIQTAMKEMSGVDFTVGYAFKNPGEALRSRRKNVQTAEAKFFKPKSPETETIGAFQ